MNFVTAFNLRDSLGYFLQIKNYLDHTPSLSLPLVIMNNLVDQHNLHVKVVVILIKEVVDGENFQSSSKLLFYVTQL